MVGFFGAGVRGCLVAVTPFRSIRTIMCVSDGIRRGDFGIRYALSG